VVGDFLVLGNLQNDGIDGYQPNRIRWSGFDNPDTWGTSVGTQADFQPMPDIGGPVVAITGRELGTIYQRKCISRMQYVGPPNIFTFDVVEQQRGAVSAGAVCNAGDLDFFYSDDGFFAWNGAASTPIGTDRVDRWVRSRLDFPKAEAIFSAYDPQTRCVMWGIPENRQDHDRDHRGLFDRGGSLELHQPARLRRMISSFTLPFRLKVCRPPTASAARYDDPAFAGGRAVLAGIDLQPPIWHVYRPHAGRDADDGRLISPNPASRSLVTGVRPIVDSAVATVAVGERNQRPSDYVAWYNPVATNATVSRRSGSMAAICAIVSRCPRVIAGSGLLLSKFLPKRRGGDETDLSPALQIRRPYSIGQSKPRHGPEP
jgi:hypothetical protein